MSLKESDWKPELNKPKNLGLKVNGTGVSQALRVAEVWRDNFGKNRTLENGKIYAKALMDVKVKCDETVNKHGKLFTTACDYLKKVSAEAKKEFDFLEPRILKANKEKLKEVPKDF